MKSRISCCNGHVLKKDILRFAPLWAVYGIFLGVYMFNNFSWLMNQPNTAQLACSFTRQTQYISLLFVFYGFGCATLLFGDLFRSRMAGGLHALPLNRQTWFGTHVVAGLLFAAVPNGVVAVVMMLFLKEYAFVAALWFLVITGQFLFHFALGVLCVMLSGNLLGHAASFGTLELLPLLIHGIYDTIYRPLLYGLVTNDAAFEFFCPAQWWRGRDWFAWDISHPEIYTDSFGYMKPEYQTVEPVYTYQGLEWESWIYLAVCVALAALLLWGALALYRRRKLEWAGDFIVSAPVRWTFLVLASIYAAIAIPVIGFVPGFFGLTMLSERTLRVFRKKNILIFAGVAAALLLSLGLTWLDPAGITDRLPEKDRIRQVTLNPNWRGAYNFTDEQAIQAALDAHALALEERSPDLTESFYTLELQYEMTDGSTLHRRYLVNTQTPAIKSLQKVLSRWELLFGGMSAEQLPEHIQIAEFVAERYSEGGEYIYTDSIILPEEDYPALVQAMYQDSLDGNLAQDTGLYDGIVQRITFAYKGQSLAEDYHTSVYIYEDSRHTLEFLQQYLQEGQQ